MIIGLLVAIGHCGIASLGYPQGIPPHNQRKAVFIFGSTVYFSSKERKLKDTMGE